MKRYFLAALLLPTLLIPQLVFGEETQEPEWYSDVEENHMYKKAIEFMTDSEFVEGYEDGTFLPMQEINRVEALKMITESSESELTAIEGRELFEFPDIDPEQWYYEYFEPAYLAGIVDGHDDGFFRPEDTVNRAEALKMLSQIYEIELEDEEEAEWYEKYIDFGGENALIIPVAGDEASDQQWDYLPGNNLTRGELCDIIYRYKQQPFTGEIEYGVASYYGDSFHGETTASGAILDINGTMGAHKTLPFGTIVRVTNLNTNLFTEVEIVDRGPYVDGRVIDLTPYAFEQVSSLSSGVFHSRVEVISSEE